MTQKRILHTSDWHLGQTFHGFERTWEHERFLAWLLETVVAREVDALLVSGDVFDTPNPSSAAQRQWFDFLVAVTRERPGCDVVATSGNHDSPQRLDAPEALTRALGLHIVGSARDAGGVFDAARLVVPLGKGSEGGVWGHVAAIPFLRGDDLGTLTELHADDGYVQLTRRRHGAVFDELASRAAPGHARFAMAHGVVVGEESASRSEREIRIGNVGGVPVDVFPADLTYVALGHLHRPQRAGGRESVQYAGSPLPLHVSEAEYAHRAVLVTVEGGALCEMESVPVPKSVPVVRVPSAGTSMSPDEVLAELRLLPSRASLPEAQQPYLDVRFLRAAPRPRFVEEVTAAIEGKGYRITTVRPEELDPKPPVPGEEVAERELDDLTPDEVFLELYGRKYPDQKPSADLLRAFGELVATVMSGGVQS